MPSHVSEFGLIRDIIARHAGAARTDVRLGIGDDAAVLDGGCGEEELVATMDTLVAGRHFFADLDAAALGHKALAVNLSDLAAMGATPTWGLLSLALPDAPPPGHERHWPAAWLAAFMGGLDALARRHDFALVGGDTVGTDGPLQLSITALGRVPAGRALSRRGARPGDWIWVSGTLGDAALALRLAFVERGRGPGLPLALSAAERAWLQARLERPEPQVALGRRLRDSGLAHAMADISDGLLADLGHILAASDARARVDLERLPLSAPLRRLAAADPALARQLALSEGDDYALCVVAAPALAAHLAELQDGLPPSARLTCIGEITAAGEAPGDPLADPHSLITLHADGHPVPLPARLGHEHFAAS
ncbi:MAG: thiamine-phosphate kinase [Pseudomonadota bacterium]